VTAVERAAEILAGGRPDLIERCRGVAEARLRQHPNRDLLAWARRHAVPMPEEAMA